MAHDSFEEDFEAANGHAFSGIVHRQYHLDVVEKKDKEIAALRAAAEKARGALKEITARDWVENALDPQWAGARARHALAALEEVLK